jgi:hypothetical protein
MGNDQLAVVMMVRVEMILGHSDDEDHCANRRQEADQS